MLHTWWTCPCIRDFWNSFFHLLRKIMGVAIPQDPTIAILRLSFFTCSCELRSCFPGPGKKTTVSLSETKQNIYWIMSQEKCVPMLQVKVQMFEAILEPWVLYVKFPLYSGFFSSWFESPGSPYIIPL